MKSTKMLRQKPLDELEKREEDLEVKTHDFEMTNAVLTVLLKKKEENKAQQTCLSILTQNLKEIIAPFSPSLSSRYLNFSHTEIRIANLVNVV